MNSLNIKHLCCWKGFENFGLDALITTLILILFVSSGIWLGQILQNSIYIDKTVPKRRRLTILHYRQIQNDCNYFSNKHNFFGQTNFLETYLSASYRRRCSIRNENKIMFSSATSFRVSTQPPTKNQRCGFIFGWHWHSQCIQYVWPSNCIHPTGGRAGGDSASQLWSLEVDIWAEIFAARFVGVGQMQFAKTQA